MAPDHKAIALRHLIKAFDLAEPNTYATTAERRALCDGLLAEHDLMDPNPQGNRQALTQDRYMSMLRQAIYDGGTNVKAFCRDGSKSMRAVYLEKIGYTPPPLAEGQNADTAPEAKTLAAAQQPGAQSGSELDQGHPGQDQADRRPSTKIHLKKPNQKQEQMPVSPPDKATGIGPFKRRSHATGAKRTLEEVESGGEEQDVARSPKKLRLEVASTGEKPAHDGTRNHPEDAAGKKRNRVIVDSEDDDAVRPAKSQHVGAAPTAPSQASSSKAASDQGLADGNGIGGKRKRDNLEEESVASARPTKSSRPTSSGSATADRVNIGGRPKPVSVSSEKQHSNRTANRAEHQGGTARAAGLDFTSASLNKQTAGPSIHDRDLVEDDDGQPIHPLFAKHNIPYSQWKKARQAEGAPSVYTLEPQERNIALGAEDPLGPVGHRHLEPLSSDAIERHLDTVWRRIEKFAINLLGQESLLEPPLAKFVANPGPELAELYQTMLGPDWRKQAAVMNMTGKLSQYNIIEGCMAAAVHQYVYEKPAKWQTPRSMLEELHSQHQLEGFNAFFKFMTDPDPHHISIQHAVWDMCRHQAASSKFAQKVLRPIAKELASTLWTVLQPQFVACGRPFMQVQEAYDFYEEQMEIFVEMFEHALILKAKMCAAPNRFTVSWIDQNAKVVIEQMEMLNGSGDWYADKAAGQTQVAWCVSPRVEVTEYVSGVTRNFVRGKVFARIP